MTGEMSWIDQNGKDSDGDWWMTHAAVAQALGGELRPFDKYQGPYILVERQKLWVYTEDDGADAIYNETTNRKMYFDGAEEDAIRAARGLIQGHGLIITY